MSAPSVSIGMSVFNNGRTIATALRSLVRQTYSDWELLLFDDGSTDDTMERARSIIDPRIRIIADGRHVGLAARLNEAVDAARGEYFARFDGDDVAFPQRLEKQIAFLRGHPEVDLLGTEALVFGAGGRILRKFSCPATHEELCRRPWRGFNGLIHPTWMGRTKWFRRYRFPEWALKSQDRDVLLQSYTQSRFACLPEVLLGYRQDTPNFRKILKSRWYFSRVLVRAAVRQCDPRFLWGVALQAAKAPVDLSALLLQFDYRERGVRSLHRDVVAEWNEVWRACGVDESAGEFDARTPVGEARTV